MERAFKKKNFRISLGWHNSLSLAFVVNYQSVIYTDNVNVVSVGDIILDNIPTVDLLFMYTWGIFIVLAIVVVCRFFERELLPFAAKTIAAFYYIRAGFINLTHWGAPENFFKLPTKYMRNPVHLNFYMNDLFFSGNTGFPFLAALIFWKTAFFAGLIMSLSQGATVLLMHVHYSIDVFSAFL